MAGEKFVFIIPGYRHKPTNRGYQEIKKLLEKEEFSSIAITIPWKKSTISENTEFFLKRYQQVVSKKQLRPSQIYFLGFSFGAMIAFLAATKITVGGLILCSLSPFFKEDLPKNQPSQPTQLQEKRWKDFADLKNNKLSKEIKAKKIFMLYGTKESRSLIKRVSATFKKVPTTKKYLFPISNTFHDIADKKYIDTLGHIVKEIL